MTNIHTCSWNGPLRGKTVALSRKRGLRRHSVRFTTGERTEVPTLVNNSVLTQNRDCDFKITEKLQLDHNDVPQNFQSFMDEEEKTISPEVCRNDLTQTCATRCSGPQLLLSSRVFDSHSTISQQPLLDIPWEMEDPTMPISPQGLPVSFGMIAQQSQGQGLQPGPLVNYSVGGPRPTFVKDSFNYFPKCTCCSSSTHDTFGSRSIPTVNQPFDCVPDIPMTQFDGRDSVYKSATGPSVFPVATNQPLFTPGYCNVFEFDPLCPTSGLRFDSSSSAIYNEGQQTLWSDYFTSQFMRTDSFHERPRFTEIRNVIGDATTVFQNMTQDIVGCDELIHHSKASTNVPSFCSGNFHSTFLMETQVHDIYRNQVHGVSRESTQHNGFELIQTSHLKQESEKYPDFTRPYIRPCQSSAPFHLLSQESKTLNYNETQVPSTSDMPIERRDEGLRWGKLHMLENEWINTFPQYYQPESKESKMIHRFDPSSALQPLLDSNFLNQPAPDHKCSEFEQKLDDPLILLKDQPFASSTTRVPIQCFPNQNLLKKDAKRRLYFEDCDSYTESDNPKSCSAPGNERNSKNRTATMERSLTGSPQCHSSGSKNVRPNDHDQAKSASSTGVFIKNGEMKVRSFREEDPLDGTTSQNSTKSEFHENFDSAVKTENSHVQRSSSVARADEFSLKSVQRRRRKRRRISPISKSSNRNEVTTQQNQALEFLSQSEVSAPATSQLIQLSEVSSRFLVPKSKASCPTGLHVYASGEACKNFDFKVKSEDSVVSRSPNVDTPEDIFFMSAQKRTPTSKRLLPVSNVELLKPSGNYHQGKLFQENHVISEPDQVSELCSHSRVSTSTTSEANVVSMSSLLKIPGSITSCRTSSRVNASFKTSENLDVKVKKGDSDAPRSVNIVNAAEIFLKSRKSCRPKSKTLKLCKNNHQAESSQRNRVKSHDNQASDPCPQLSVLSSPTSQLIHLSGLSSQSVPGSITSHPAISRIYADGENHKNVEAEMSTGDCDVSRTQSVVTAAEIFLKSTKRCRAKRKRLNPLSKGKSLKLPGKYLEESPRRNEVTSQQSHVPGLCSQYPVSASGMSQPIQQSQISSHTPVPAAMTSGRKNSSDFTTTVPAAVTSQLNEQSGVTIRSPVSTSVTSQQNESSELSSLSKSSLPAIPKLNDGSGFCRLLPVPVSMTPRQEHELPESSTSQQNELDGEVVAPTSVSTLRGTERINYTNMGDDFGANVCGSNSNVKENDEVDGEKINLDFCVKSEDSELGCSLGDKFSTNACDMNSSGEANDETSEENIKVNLSVKGERPDQGCSLDDNLSFSREVTSTKIPLKSPRIFLPRLETTLKNGLISSFMSNEQVKRINCRRKEAVSLPLQHPSKETQVNAEKTPFQDRGCSSSKQAPVKQGESVAPVLLIRDEQGCSMDGKALMSDVRDKTPSNEARISEKPSSEKTPCSDEQIVSVEMQNSRRPISRSSHCLQSSECPVPSEEDTAKSRAPNIVKVHGIRFHRLQRNSTRRSRRQFPQHCR